MKSKNRYAGRRTPGRKPSKQDPFEEVRIFVPRWLMARLRRIGDVRGVTPERLIVRALWVVRNLIEGMDADLNLSDVMAGESTAEQQSHVYQYLTAARDVGVELELLIMCYDDLGFVSPQQLKQVLNDLVHLGLVIIFNGGDGEVRIKAIVRQGRVREKGFRLFGGEKL